MSRTNAALAITQAVLPLSISISERAPPRHGTFDWVEVLAWWFHPNGPAVSKV